MEAENLMVEESEGMRNGKRERWSAMAGDRSGKESRRGKIKKER